MYRIESRLEKVALDELRPTQMTVGFGEVQAKRKCWAKLSADKRRDAMAEQLFPAVKGPDKRYFILDHHHTALALVHEEARHVQVGPVKDLSKLSFESFWVFLDHYSWVHCYNANGKRRPVEEMPERFEDLADDPYRSLAAQVRDAGGYAKVDTPFLDFLWANYLRDAVPSRRLANPKRALEDALAIASSKRASHLPGWCGKA